MPAEEFYFRASKLLSELREEIEPEEAQNQSVNLELYKLLQEKGVSKNLVILDNDEIVGHAFIELAPNIHFKDRLNCYVRTIYLKREYRRGKFGITFLEAIELFAIENGATNLSYGAKSGTTLEKILRRLDYDEKEVVLVKKLKE